MWNTVELRKRAAFLTLVVPDFRLTHGPLRTLGFPTTRVSPDSLTTPDHLTTPDRLTEPDRRTASHAREVPGRHCGHRRSVDPGVSIAEAVPPGTWQVAATFASPPSAVPCHVAG